MTKNMIEGRRRSGRLIASPWLYKWPKKPPVYIDLNPDLDTPNNVLDGSNARTTLSKCKKVDNIDSSSEDDDFVTPRENFGDIRRSMDRKCMTGKKRLKLTRDLAVIENESNAIVVVGGVSETERNMCVEDDDAMHPKNLRSRIKKDNPLKRKHALLGKKKKKISNHDSPVNRNLSVKKTVTTVFMEMKDADYSSNASGVKRKISSKKARTSVGRGVKDGTHISRTKKKPMRIYNRYIQKKFSLSIMSDVIINLSGAQREWVRNTGFGELLNFRMVCYTHNLGYNVVEAFDGAACSMLLQGGSIKITESIVHSVMGLPIGDADVECNKDRTVFSEWAEQFPGSASCGIRPTMVRDKILANPRADKSFKWNFLILMYNFFIESNQNSFLTRDILRFSGDIETCGNYNWCRLLIEKLKKTHAYWAEDTKRNFAGPLPFLIYLYVSKCKNKGTTFIQTNYPTFRGWSDMLLRERQKYDSKQNCFGEGEIVKFHDVTMNGVLDIQGEVEEGKLLELDDGTELTMRDIVIRQDIQNENETNPPLTIQKIVGEVDMLTPASIHEESAEAEEDESDASVEQDEVLCHNQKSQDGSTEHVDSARNVIDAQFRNKKKVGEVNMHTPMLVHEENPGPEFYAQEAENLAKLVDKLNNCTDFGKDQIGEFDTRAPFQTVEETKNLFAKDALAGETLATKIPIPDSSEVCGDGANVVQNTQTHVDLEIDQHFDETTYLLSFENNLKEFEELYGRCLNNFEVTLALYPQNRRLAELKKRYSQYFKMFEAASPIAKNLLVGNMGARGENKSALVNDDDFIPNYSLGISQLTPKNLCSDLNVTGNVQMEGSSRIVISPGEKELVPNTFIGDKEQKKTTAEMERPRRDIKASALCRSPYVSRIVDVGNHVLTTEERNVWQWLFQNRRNKKDDLFEWNGRMCTKAHFQSLEVGKKVMTTLIDTWTYLLNDNEKLKADTSPLRVFMTTETTYGPLQLEVGEDEFEKTYRYAPFNDNMDIVMNMVQDMHNKEYEVKDFDMFVFPIYNSGHHYIICYDMKKPRLDIIDNMVPTDGVELTYGDIPSKLHDYFCQWISIYNVPKESEIVNLKPKVHRMGWQTEMNSIDCEIFAMRHMETYMGNLRAWKAGLRSEKDNQQPLLNKLRIIYCHKLLTWRGNSKRTHIMESVANLAKGQNLVQNLF